MSDEHAGTEESPKSRSHGHAHHAPHGPPHGGDHEEAHEGAPEWLISFADNVALMMGFFVILLAMNMGPKGASAGESKDPASASAFAGSADMLDAVVAIREGFNNPVNFESPRPQDVELVRLLRERGKLLDVLDHAPSGKQREVQSVRPGDYHKLATVVRFPLHAAKPGDAEAGKIAEIAVILRGMRNVVEVVGHASAAEADEPRQSLRLSFDRAVAVATALADAGVPWDQLRVIAAGDKDRVVDRAYSPDEQHTNQRVEILVTEKVQQVR